MLSLRLLTHALVDILKKKGWLVAVNLIGGTNSEIPI